VHVLGVDARFVERAHNLDQTRVGAHWNGEQQLLRIGITGPVGERLERRLCGLQLIRVGDGHLDALAPIAGLQLR
jgi:hypothetical protein